MKYPEGFGDYTVLVHLPFLWGFSFLHSLHRSSGTWDRSHHVPKEKKDSFKDATNEQRRRTARDPPPK